MPIDPSTIATINLHQATLIDAANNHNKFYDVYYVRCHDESTYAITHYGRNGSAGTWKQIASGAPGRYAFQGTADAATKQVAAKAKGGYENNVQGWHEVTEIRTAVAQVANVCEPMDPNQDPVLRSKMTGDPMATLIEQASKAISLAANPDTVYEAATLRENLHLSVSEARERLLYAESQLEIIDSLVASSVSVP